VFLLFIIHICAYNSNSHQVSNTIYQATANTTTTKQPPPTLWVSVVNTTVTLPTAKQLLPPTEANTEPLTRQQKLPKPTYSLSLHLTIAPTANPTKTDPTRTPTTTFGTKTHRLLAILYKVLTTALLHFTTLSSIIFGPLSVLVSQLIDTPAPPSNKRRRRRRALHYHLHRRCLRRRLLLLQPQLRPHPVNKTRSSNRHNSSPITPKTATNSYALRNSSKLSPPRYNRIRNPQTCSKHTSPKHRDTEDPIPTEITNPSVPPFLVFVKSLTGKTVSIQAHPHLTTLHLKQQLLSKTNVPTADQRLIYNGKQLNDLVQLHNYNILPNALLHMSARLPGGYKSKNSTMPHRSRQPNKSSQARAAKHREQIKQCQTGYQTGLIQKRTQTMPSADDLRQNYFQEQRSSDCDKKATLRDHFNMATEIVSARQQQKKLAKLMLDQLNTGGVGSVPEEKKEDTARFTVNSVTSNFARFDLTSCVA
jgi:hypothetical protein